MKLPILILIIGLSITAYSQKQVNPPTPVLPIPSAEQLAWQQMEMNAFIHFTVNTFTDMEWGLGNEKETIFNPTSLNVEQWIETLKSVGFKGIVLTAKHHDGFCLWPSKYTEHSVKNSTYKNGKGDIVKEVLDACKKNNLKFGIYLSPWDRNNEAYGTPAYIQYYRNQLTELITNYGPVFEVWFDGANGGEGYYGGKMEKRRIDSKTYYDWPTTIELVKKLNPGVVFFSDAGPGCRWTGNEEGKAGETNWSTISLDTLYAGKPNIEDLLNVGSENGKNWVPAEVDVSIRPGWFYHAKQDSLVRTPENLFELYLNSVGRNALLLLNVPPDKRGLIHENDVKSLQGFKKLLDNEFRVNLAESAKIKASSIRGNDNAYSSQNLLDNDFDTYWATNDNERTASIEVDLKSTQTVKYILLQEYIKLGQRIKSFSVEAWIDNKWQTIAKGTTIGYKHILKLNSIKTDKIKVVILDSKACPVISSIKIF